MRYIAVVLLLLIVTVCFIDAKVIPWVESAKKGKFCTRVCGNLKGPLLLKFKNLCIQKCRNARDKVVIKGANVNVCTTLCSSLPASFAPVCKKNCDSVLKTIPVPKIVKPKVRKQAIPT